MLYAALYKANNGTNFMRISAAQLKKLQLTQRRKVVGVSQQEMAKDLEIDLCDIKELELEDEAMQKLLNRIKEDKNDSTRTN